MAQMNKKSLQRFFIISEYHTELFQEPQHGDGRMVCETLHQVFKSCNYDLSEFIPIKQEKFMLALLPLISVAIQRLRTK